jgi:hypothetical protein
MWGRTLGCGGSFPLRAVAPLSSSLLPPNMLPKKLPFLSSCSFRARTGDRWSGVFWIPMDRCDGVVKAETVAPVQHTAIMQAMLAAEILIVVYYVIKPPLVE